MKSSKPRRVILLGATGSIGSSTREVARALPDSIHLVGLSSWQNDDELLRAAHEFHPEIICAGPSSDLAALRAAAPAGTRVVQGESGLLELAAWPSADIVLLAIVGAAGLPPALAAIEAGKDLAVAGKEVLVMAGPLVMAAARHHQVRILPVDSEHNAIFQCLEGRDPATVRQLHLTCSGGPFRQKPVEEFPWVTPESALRHPTWDMGRKISVDSATLFNKGLEMIEARWLFDIPMDRIQVVIHPQSLIHSLVEFVDGSFLAQLSRTSMTFPIQFALTYPERMPGTCTPLDLTGLGQLDFLPPREADFPALALARQAGARSGTAPAVLNAANEEAVHAFLRHELSFPGIWQIVARALADIPFHPTPDLQALLQADQAARTLVRDLVQSGFSPFPDSKVKKVAAGQDFG